jgi:hypothetical protein
MELTYLLSATSLFKSLEVKTNKLKEKALKEYEEALKMPRKKKKKAKKSAILLYNIATWEPFKLK